MDEIAILSRSESLLLSISSLVVLLLIDVVIDFMSIGGGGGLERFILEKCAFEFALVVKGLVLCPMMLFSCKYSIPFVIVS